LWLTLWLGAAGAVAPGALAAAATGLAEPSPNETPEETSSEPTTADATLTLDRALALALERNPGLAVHRFELDAARAAELSAAVYPHNPELEVEAADRRGLDGSSTDHGLSLTQELELAGQRAKRRALAGAGTEASRRRFQRRRAELVAAVEDAFAHAVAARELARIARLDADLARRMVETESRRLEAGAGTQIDLNLARAAAGRTESVLAHTRAESWSARAILAELVGLDPAAPPEVDGELPHRSARPGSRSAPEPETEEVVARALASRADLQALRRQAVAEERRVELERASGRPNLRLRAFFAREEGDDLAGAAVGVALPLFDRNQGAIAGATVARDRARARVAAAELEVRREVAAALVRYRAGLDAVAAFEGQVVSSLDESLDLLDRAFLSGKVGITEVLIQRRELIDARRQEIQAAESAWRARLELELATGEILDAAEGAARAPAPAAGEPGGAS